MGQLPGVGAPLALTTGVGSILWGSLLGSGLGKWKVVGWGFRSGWCRGEAESLSFLRPFKGMP